MVYGSKEAYQYYCMSLAEQGFAVVTFNYRLAPEFKFPAVLEDTALVMANLMPHKGTPEEYHYYGDAEHVLGHVFQCNIRLPEAIECTREECAFLQRFVTHHSF